MQSQNQLLQAENSDLHGRFRSGLFEPDPRTSCTGLPLTQHDSGDMPFNDEGNSVGQSGIAHLAKSDAEEAKIIQGNLPVVVESTLIASVNTSPDKMDMELANADVSTYLQPVESSDEWCLKLANVDASGSTDVKALGETYDCADFKRELFKIYNVTKHQHLSTKIPECFTRWTGVDAGTILNLEERLLVRRLQCDLLLQLVRGKFFSWLINFLILLNLVSIVAECDYNARKSFKLLAGDDPHPDDLDTLFDISDIFFACAFSSEVVLRIVAEEWAFCIGWCWKMNLFDLFLVIINWCELALGMSGVDLTQARLLRILRLTKALKGVRVLRFFKDLRVIFDAVMHIMSPLMWSGLVLFAVILFFSIIFVQVVTDRINSYEQDQLDPVRAMLLEKYFGSLPMGMLTLFMSLTGGESWSIVVLPLTEISVANGLAFVAFIVLVQLGVLNIITSLFVEQAAHFSEKDSGNMLVAHAEHNNYLMQQLGKIFDVLDEDGDEVISFAEFEKWSQFPESRAFFKQVLGIDGWMVRRLFNLMDLNESGMLDRGEFVMGCMRLSGYSANLDVQAIRKDLKKTKRNTDAINRGLNGAVFEVMHTGTHKAHSVNAR